MKTTVPHCARCGGRHEGLSFQALARPMEGYYTHWATCPETGEPIMLRLVERKPDRFPPVVDDPRRTKPL